MDGWISLGCWVVSVHSSEWLLTDVLPKTGSVLLRRSFVNQLKSMAIVQYIDFSVRSPEGTNKIPSYYFMVRLESTENQKVVLGLFEYAYGAIRLVAVDDNLLASHSGITIVSFFETVLSQEKQDVKAVLLQPIQSETSSPTSPI